MQNTKYLISAITIVLVLGLFLGLLWIYAAQQRLSVYNLQSYERSGLKAVELLLEKAGFRLNEVHAVPANPTGTIILLSAGPIPAHELKRLKVWVKSGGTIIELARNESILNQNSGETSYVHFSGSTGCLSDTTVLNDLRYFPRNESLAGRTDPTEGYYSLDHRHYFIYRVRFGQGNIVAWNDLEGLTNIHLKHHPDNAVVFVSLLKTLSGPQRLFIYNLCDAGVTPGRVHFHWRTMDFFNRYWGAFVLFLTAVILLFWKTAARFGRPRPLQIAQGRSYHEFVMSLAHLFKMARLQGAVTDNLWNALLNTVSQVTGLPAFTELTIMNEKLSAMTGKEFNLPRLQTEAARFSRTPARPRSSPGERSFIAVAQSLDACRRELNLWKKSNNW